MNGVNEDSDQYDPDQRLDERRRIQQGMRDLGRELNDNRDEFLKPDVSLYDRILAESDHLLRQTKRTTEATIDSRTMLNITELAHRRQTLMTAGGAGNGIDVDEFISKVITYMRNGGGIQDDADIELSSTQRRRRTSVRTSNSGPAAAGRGGRRGTIDDDLGEDDDGDGDDQVGDEGDMLNWAHLGKYACMPYMRRPPVPGFLLGPLSVERRARRVGQRTAPLRINSLQEVRPEVLNVNDIRKVENDLAVICGDILKQLRVKEEAAQEAMVAAYSELLEDEQTDAARQRLFDRFAVRDTGGVDMIRFVINPRSFSQTVENIFYVSFLIRDGKIRLEFDDNGLPSITAFVEEEENEANSQPATRRDGLKHQAIISIDHEIWQNLITTFDISEPMIAHRPELETRELGARGWYG